MENSIWKEIVECGTRTTTTPPWPKAHPQPHTYTQLNPSYIFRSKYLCSIYWFLSNNSWDFFFTWLMNFAAIVIVATTRLLYIQRFSKSTHFVTYCISNFHFTPTRQNRFQCVKKGTTRKLKRSVLAILFIVFDLKSKMMPANANGLAKLMHHGIYPNDEAGFNSFFLLLLLLLLLSFLFQSHYANLCKNNEISTQNSMTAYTHNDNATVSLRSKMHVCSAIPWEHIDQLVVIVITIILISRTIWNF